VKRGKPLTRKTPLKPGSGGLKASGPLRRTTPLRTDADKNRAFMQRARQNSKRPEPLPPEVRAAAYARTRGRCINCGTEETAQYPHHPHHVFPKRNFPELREHPDNIVLLCADCHMNAEFSAFKRLSRKKLPMCVFQLAARHPDRTSHLMRFYDP
jgi:5-methylcytosine-specific restriction endonuclease McrA